MRPNCYREENRCGNCKHLFDSSSISWATSKFHYCTHSLFMPKSLKEADKINIQHDNNVDPIYGICRLWEK